MADRPGSKLYALFVDRPVLSLMATIALLLVGVIALLRVPLAFMPGGFVSHTIQLYIPIPRPMPPREVEETVAKPFEEYVRTIEGLKSVRSTCNANSVRVEIELAEGLDPTLLAAEVRDKTQRAQLVWPKEIDRYFTWREDGSSMPLAFFQILTPAKNPAWDFLIDDVVRPRLESVDGIGRVDVWGLLDETIRIWFDRDKLLAHGINFRQMLERLGTDNFTQPIGEIDDGQRRLSVRVDGKFKSTHEIEAWPVRPGLVVGDIATVERVPTIRDNLARYDGKYTYGGMVRMTAGANPVETSQRLERACEELRSDPQLSGIEFHYQFDQGKFIKTSLDTLIWSGIEGGLAALAVLWLFLRSVRFTLVIALSIPLSMLFVGAWLFFTGDTLNILTMAGMTIAVGMVVDNAVVVLENIRRLHAEGMPLRDACVEGAREIGLAVTLATLTSVVVFLPMIFMGGAKVRVMLGAVGLPLSVALLASLVVALLLIPAGMRWVGAGGGTAGSEPLVESRWSPTRLLRAVNSVLLRWSLRHRILAVLGSILVLATMWFPMHYMDFSAGDQGPFRGGDVTMRMDIERGLTLADVEREVRGYESFLMARKEEFKIAHVSTRFSRTSARVDIVAKQGTKPAEIEEVRKRVTSEWPRRPGLKVILREKGGGGMGGGGGGEEKEQRNFVVRLYGSDSEHLADLALQVRDELRGLPEVESIDAGQLERNEEVVVEIDRERAQDLGVESQNLFGTVSSGLRGRELGRFEEEGRELRLIAQFQGLEKASLLDLKDTQVFGSRGAFQRVDDLSKIRFRRSLQTIERNDGRTSVAILGRRAETVGPLAFSAALAKAMAKIPLPRGYSWREDSPSTQTQMEFKELLQALGLSIVLVFLLMGVLFESVILPLACLTTIPFGLFGGAWTLWVMRGGMDPMSIVGCVLLAGVVVNNGIVLLDCVQRLRLEGMPRDEAILQATRQRLRPILMTAATTIIGLVPTILQGDAGQDGISYVTMSIVVAGGLLFCTIFTAFAVPLAYTLIDDFSMFCGGIVQRALGVRTSAPAT